MMKKYKFQTKMFFFKFDVCDAEPVIGSVLWDFAEDKYISERNNGLASLELSWSLRICYSMLWWPQVRFCSPVILVDEHVNMVCS